MGNERLSTESRIDCHNEYMIQVLQDIGKEFYRSVRIDCNSRLHTQCTDLLNITMEISAGLKMNDKYICAGFFKCRGKLFRFFNHQMYITYFFCCFTDMFNHRNAEADIGYKSSVHHIQVKPVRLAFIYESANLFQVKKIRGEQGRCNQRHVSIFLS